MEIRYSKETWYFSRPALANPKGSAFDNQRYDRIYRLSFHFLSYFTVEIPQNTAERRPTDGYRRNVVYGILGFWRKIVRAQKFNHILWVVLFHSHECRTNVAQRSCECRMAVANQSHEYFASQLRIFARIYSRDG